MLHSYKLSCITFAHFSGSSYPPWKCRAICSKSWDAQGNVFIHHPWLGEWWEGVRIGGAGDITLGSFFPCTLRTQPLVVEGGRFLSLISRTAPSTLIAGSQRQPEVKGEWMSEQHPRRGKKREEGERGKKAMFIPLRLYQVTAALQFSA